MVHKHKRLISLALLGSCGIAAMGFVLGFESAPATGQSSRSSVAAPTTILVTAGKPSENKFTLSKFSGIPAGKIIFKVTNKGKLDHGFAICTAPSSSSKANSCTGKSTKSLAPGRSATLTVTVASAGKYEYLSKLPGQAAAGAKGLLSVRAAPSTGGLGPVTPTTTGKVVTGTTPATTTTSAPPTTGSSCASPKSTTVQVAEFEYAFTLSQSSVPCGTVTFSMTNTGQIQHNFDVLGVKNDAGVGPFLNPGDHATMTVTLAPGSYQYQCDEDGHAAMGMMGTLTVTS
jgi:uncharacterized cupredoxin-like copper-binding protein